MSISISLLSSLPFFEDIDELAKVEFCNIATLRNFKAAATIGRAGEAHESAGYILSGRLQSKQLADDGRVVSISIMGPGAWVGWLAIVDGRYVSEEIRCLTECQIITFPVRLIRPLVQTNTVLLGRLLQLAVQTIEAARHERMMLTLPNAFQRICFQISHLSSDIDSDTLERISALPRQQELASAANTSRETVSRTLQMLMKAGIIHKSGHRVVVRRVDLLRRLVYDGPELLENNAFGASSPKSRR